MVLALNIAWFTTQKKIFGEILCEKKNEVPKQGIPGGGNTNNQ